MTQKRNKTIKPTDAQWKFASEYVRTQSVLAAFKAAYPKHAQKTIGQLRPLARRQLGQEGTQMAIRELTQDVRAAEKLTVEQHMAELRKIRDKAYEEGKLSVARQAEVDRGKCAGFYIERSMNVNVISSPQELQLQWNALMEQYPQAAQMLLGQTDQAKKVIESVAVESDRVPSQSDEATGS